MSFKTRRLRSNPKAETRCLATHFRYMRESLPDAFGDMDQIPKVIQQPASQSGIFKIGGDTPVHRLGFGAMRLTGNGVWGEPENPAECIAVLRALLIWASILL